MYEIKIEFVEVSSRCFFCHLIKMADYLQFSLQKQWSGAIDLENYLLSKREP